MTNLKEENTYYKDTNCVHAALIAIANFLYENPQIKESEAEKFYDMAFK